MHVDITYNNSKIYNIRHTIYLVKKASISIENIEKLTFFYFPENFTMPCLRW